MAVRAIRILYRYVAVRPARLDGEPSLRSDRRKGQAQTNVRSCGHQHQSIGMNCTPRKRSRYVAPMLPNEPVEDCALFGQPLERADIVSAHARAVAGLPPAAPVVLGSVRRPTLGVQ
jgi:hypothetical protein